MSDYPNLRYPKAISSAFPVRLAAKVLSAGPMPPGNASRKSSQRWHFSGPRVALPSPSSSPPLLPRLLTLVPRSCQSLAWLFFSVYVRSRSGCLSSNFPPFVTLAGNLFFIVFILVIFASIPFLSLCFYFVTFFPLLFCTICIAPTFPFLLLLQFTFAFVARPLVWRSLTSSQQRGLPVGHKS